MGKNKYIETPEKMWEYFIAYKEEIKANPISIIEQKKGGTSIKMNFEVRNKKDIQNIRETFETFNDSTVKLPAQKPLTFEGFQNWLEDNEIITDVTDYFENKEERYSEYVRVCSRIKRNIRQDQIEGGMAGIYNPSITQRLNGLVDKKDIESGGEKLQVSPATVILPDGKTLDDYIVK